MENCSLPNDVIIVSQVKLLRVLPGVVDHANPGHEIHDLFPSRVVEVVTALVAPVAVNPLEPELAAWRGLIGHARALFSATVWLTRATSEDRYNSLFCLTPSEVSDLEFYIHTFIHTYAVCMYVWVCMCMCVCIPGISKVGGV